MSTKIQILRNSTSGTMPTAQQLDYGQLAINYGTSSLGQPDGRLFYIDAGGVVRWIAPNRPLSGSNFIYAWPELSGAIGSILTTSSSISNVLTWSNITGSPIGYTEGGGTTNPGSFSSSIDNNIATRWTTNTNQVAGQRYHIKLNTTKSLVGYIMNTLPSSGDSPATYDISGSIDLGATWFGLTGSVPGTSYQSHRFVSNSLVTNLSLTLRSARGGVFWSIYDFEVIEQTTGSIDNVVGLSWADPSASVSSSYAVTSSWATTASWAPDAFDATVSRGYTGSFTGSITGSINSSSYALSSSWALTSSYAMNGGGGVPFDPTVERGYSGSFTGSATGNLTGTSSWAITASYAMNGGGTPAGVWPSTAPYSLFTDTFQADGATSNFTLANTFNLEDLIVSVGGLTLTPTIDYSVAGTTLTITPTPPSSSNILVREAIRNPTGSYTGSVTGALEGTSSWAVTASYAMNGGGGGPFDPTVERGYSGSFTGSVTGALQGTSSWAVSSSWAPGGSSNTIKYYVQDAPPITAHYLNDEFTGSALSAKWTRTNTSGLVGSASVYESWYHLTSTPAFGEHMTQGTSSDTGYKFVARVSYGQPYVNNRVYGIVVWSRVSAKAEFFYIGPVAGTPTLQLDRGAGNPPVWSAGDTTFTTGLNRQSCQNIYLQYWKDSSNNEGFQYSWNGVDWIDFVGVLGTSTRTTSTYLGGVPTDIGLTYTSNAVGATSGAFDYFRYTGSISASNHLCGREITMMIS